MRNKILICILIVALVSSLVLLGACNNVPMAEYCTVKVVLPFKIPPENVHEFKVIKGERFTISQVFNTVSLQGLYDSMDLYQLTYSDGKPYDESKPVESNLNLIATTGVCWYMVYITAVVKSDRLKEHCDQKGIDDYESSIYTLTDYHFLREESILGLFDIEFDDVKYALSFDTTIMYDNFDQAHEELCNHNLKFDEEGRAYGENIQYSPNLHYPVMSVWIYLY